jgi:integrating conjugative element protein (TIGR03756 family)
MIKKSLVILLCLLASAQSFAFTSVTPTTETLAAAVKTDGNCLRYKMPTRFCIWLSPVAGRNVTPILDHYLPDLVVTVYRNSGDNPWAEVNKLIDTLPSNAQEKFLPNVGSGNHSFLTVSDQQVIFKEADVIGNPGLIVLPDRLKFLLLPSTAKPMNPYYQSMLDSALWRGLMPQAALEEAESVVLGQLHKVGKNLVDWGGVYPHEGTVQGNHDAKASMVIAQRATDLLTNQKIFGHITQSLSQSCGQHCEAAAIEENSEETLFQMIYPEAQTTCSIFGEEGLFDNPVVSDDGAYAWIVWRHYTGCADGDGIFIGETP